MIQRPRSSGAMAALLIACCGCGGLSGTPAVSASSEEAAVKGTVRIRGKLVTNGTVTFNCGNVRRPQERPREAPIQKDGTYTVKTLVGQNYAVVSCQELQKAENRRYTENETAFDVQSGENTFDINIPPGPQPPPK